uniref:Uncharacterized protein n=1 Tax=Arundo donax TaxID=35708 RepID=A0A0A9HR35_ARUDO
MSHVVQMLEAVQNAYQQPVIPAAGLTKTAETTSPPSPTQLPMAPPSAATTACGAAEATSPPFPTRPRPPLVPLPPRPPLQCTTLFSCPHRKTDHRLLPPLPDA